MEWTKIEPRFRDSQEFQRNNDFLYRKDFCGKTDSAEIWCFRNFSGNRIARDFLGYYWYQATQRWLVTCRRLDYAGPFF